MKANDAPKKHSTPFGVNGPREDILADTPSGSNQASYDDGFPAITMTLKSAGGLPPKGQDMNQILFELSSQGRYLSAGGGYQFDAAFATSLAGYPKGALIPNSTASGYWLNTIDDNSTNPENTTAAITGWVPVDSYGVTNISGLAAASITATTLQASKDRIVLSGALTANISLVLPAWVKVWRIDNNCTGNFTVTVKTPSGTGVASTSGSSVIVYGDGVNINTSNSPGSLLGSPQIFTVSGTYTPTPGTKKIIVEVQGGGGGGGGIGAAGSSTVAIGNGGGAGGYAKSMITSGITTTAITVGTGGAGGNLAPTNGTDGGLSSFGSVIVANGGGGGLAQAQTGVPYTVTPSTGGVCTGGNIVNARGGASSPGIAASTGAIFPGNGGASFYGGQTLSPANNGATPVSALGYGNGGGGGFAYNRAGFSGGAGAGGVVIVWEYS